MALGNNIFCAQSFSLQLQRVARFDDGAIVFVYCVQDSERYSVVERNERGKFVSEPS